ncbi:unnamed protein product [Paramecium pentaurelia]|uniref:Uncharacterized protein n=1 Tax=Paramecium pentaurelia TaxID=43138 RepID=A0A8S1T926_9CILI|nr:unnamed protein product [Paramecium pentaurelia]
MQYQEFKKLISQQRIRISQGDFLQKYQKLNRQIAIYKNRIYQVNMEDQLTQLTIIYPMRCKFCTNLEICTKGYESYLVEITYQRIISPKKLQAFPL